MQAIILAAGMGKRLKQLTQNNTKCMVKVNGVPLINRTLNQLEQHNLSRIVIVTGYEGQKLREHIEGLHIKTPVVFIDNPVYDRTNNIYSLFLAKDYLLKEDTLLLESDIIFEDSVLNSLTDDPRDSLALAAKYESWMDGTCLVLSDQDDIEAMIPGKKFRFSDTEHYYKTVNLYKFSQEFSRTHYVPFLEAYTKALGNNEYYEQVLKVLITLDDPGIKAKRLDENQRWYEIDDIQDLNIAESIFAPEKERTHLIQKRFGGYWRYPKMLDFCYLVNSYYPPQKMMDEIKHNFDVLARQYPSGMAVNSLLAARNFSLRQDQIVVGNGAAELIKALMERVKGNLGVIRPTFEEYANRCDKEKVIAFVPQTEDFSYNENDVMNFFEDKNLDCLVLVNPDNPTGNYISREGMLKLARWTKKKGIRFLADESFVDFAEETEPTLLVEELLDENPHMIVVKSISKSYGIPGLRLGVAASGDTDLIGQLKKDVAIWNINSFGEFYMQIEEKYRKDYASALDKLRTERTRFAEKLGSLPGVRIFPSQANYLMVELTGENVKATEITELLLTRYNLFIKDLSSKISRDDRQFLRIAIRNEEEDDVLVKALEEILTH